MPLDNLERTRRTVNYDPGNHHDPALNRNGHVNKIGWLVSKPM